MKDKIREIVAPLINEKADFVINEELKDPCYICGFPLSKEVRTKAVDQATDQILTLIREEVEGMDVASMIMDGLGIEPREHMGDCTDEPNTCMRCLAELVATDLLKRMEGI